MLTMSKLTGVCRDYPFSLESFTAHEVRTRPNIVSPKRLTTSARIPPRYLPNSQPNHTHSTPTHPPQNALPRVSPVPPRTATIAGAWRAVSLGRNRAYQLPRLPHPTTTDATGPFIIFPSQISSPSAAQIRKLPGEYVIRSRLRVLQASRRSRRILQPPILFSLRALLLPPRPLTASRRHAK